RHLLFQQRQHRPVRGDAGAGADQQVARVGVGGHQAEAAERAARLDVVAFVQALEQRGRRAAGDVADRDLHRVARAQRVVVDGRQRIAAPGRGAVGVLEVHLQELARKVVQRLSVIAHERQVGHGRREHATPGELQRKALDGGQESDIVLPGRGPAGRLYYRLAAAPARPGGPITARTRPPAGASAAAPPALSVHDLRKTYDNRVEALKGISLDVQPGDFYALLGPNGAGKSTLIGIVSSLVNKTSGEVRVFGIDLHARRDEAMRLIGL